MTTFEIIELVSDVTGVSVDDMLSKSRTREIQDAKKMAIGIIREHTGMTANRIGFMFSVTHASILNALRWHKSLIESIPQYKQNYEKILSNF